MNKITTLITAIFLMAFTLNAQNPATVYATMSHTDALAFKTLYPKDIQIFSANNNQAAVLINTEVSHKIHDLVDTHGPGYIFMPSLEKAEQAIKTKARRSPLLDYTITEETFVNECLDLVDGQNIEDDILDLQDYGTRYHTSAEAIDAVMDQKAKWDAMILASGRTDVTTRIFNHVNTPMPSVILTFAGANLPSEFVIIGGHIDSTTFINATAPGADDNASGIASLNEMVRVLLANNFIPSRTVEVMAFAAEEIGLVGSSEIAQEYAANNVNVAAFVQFDMTGYKGSSQDIFIMEDTYTSDTLNNYLISLMDFYNTSGDHNFTYGFSLCNYGCSDHASWAQSGFDVSFPFESDFSETNPTIHTPADLYAFFDEPDHSVKFTKLGLEFLIEAAKQQVLAVDDFSETAMAVFVKDRILNYKLNNKASSLKKISIYNVSGQLIVSEKTNNIAGNLSLQQFTEGFYIAKISLENGQVLTRKFILD